MQEYTAQEVEDMKTAHDLILEEYQDREATRERELEQLRADRKNLMEKAEAYDEVYVKLEKAESRIKTLNAECEKAAGVESALRKQVTQLRADASDGREALYYLREEAKLWRLRAKGINENEQLAMNAESRIDSITDPSELVDIISENRDAAYMRGYLPQQYKAAINKHNNRIENRVPVRLRTA